jgi:PEP-CTERM motif
MKQFKKMLITAAAMAAGLASSANSAVIFFGDANGKVGSYDTVTSTQTTIGSLSAFSIGQVVGLAYDGASNTLYILDRNGNNVYKMNATTGASSLAFNSTSGGTFQGGAVKGTTLFGVSENNQTLEGFTLTGTNLGIPGDNLEHTHGVGVNAASGQLYVSKSGSVYAISDAGILGALAYSGSTFMEDVDYFAGNFAYVTFDNNLYTTAGGGTVLATITGFSSLSGIALKQGAAVTPAVPEPATWGMMLVGFGVAGVALRRRGRTTAALA